jgi:hypothetical protein
MINGKLIYKGIFGKIQAGDLIISAVQQPEFSII